MSRTDRKPPQQYGPATRFTMDHTPTAGVLVSLVVGLWALVLTLPPEVAVFAAVVTFGIHFVCWRTDGPLRRRVERSYDEDRHLRP